MVDDAQLLKLYAHEGDEDAFAQLLARHLHLVYATALRKLDGDAAMAEDVTQNVFLDLARKASSLTAHPSLAGWLHTSACYAAAKVIRVQKAQRAREETVSQMPESTHHASDERWQELAPVIDDALNELPQTDRELLLLRFFSGQKFLQIGLELGVSDNAARMRVERALDKLRALLAKRGMTAGWLSMLASVIERSVCCVEVPANLAASITVAVGGGVKAAGSWSAVNILAMKPLGAPILALIFTALIAYLAVLLNQKAELEGSLSRAEHSLAESAMSPQIQAPVITPQLAAQHEERRELMRLRARATALAADNARLRLEATNEVVGAVATNAVAQPKAWKLGERRRVGDFKHVGLETPEAAAETILWAVMNDPGQLASMVYLPDDLKHLFGSSQLDDLLAPRREITLHEVWLEFYDDPSRSGKVPVHHWDRITVLEGVRSVSLAAAGSDGVKINQGEIMPFLNVDGQWKLILMYSAPENRHERNAEADRLSKGIEKERFSTMRSPKNEVP